MIDIHCHILPGIDDGAKDWEDSLAMAERAWRQGVRHIFATPHLCASRPQYSYEIAREKVDSFQKLLNKNNIPLTVHRGAELEMEMEILDYIESDHPEIFLGEGKKYILLHFPLSSIPFYAKSLIFGIAGKGITPILAHPERNFEIHKNYSLIKELMGMGAKIQVSTGSIVGAYNRQTEKNAWQILKNRWASFIATDSHSPRSRLFGEAMKRAGKLDKNAENFVSVNPEKIISGSRSEFQKVW